jgi:serine/threonine protein kinase/DNA-binding winged helix-turn-helix (wHTH) protein
MDPDGSRCPATPPATPAARSAQTAASDSPTVRRWLFGSAEFDERTLELKVSGEIYSLERKSLEVLLHLLHHAGEVVTRDELLEAVWPGRILTDSSVTSCVAKLRSALADDNQEIIKTAHGYGYRLVAPVRVETVSALPPPRFDFKAGDAPPLRPNWALVERLGTGGHGEVWLARHLKTREERVFKFALDPMALTSLKREITIYRLLHDALGDRPDFVQILDWNLEEPPYFIESEQAGTNLIQWAEKQGGLDKVSLEARLEIAAQIAETLAAAHSVGVLHKDLKPSNVLVTQSDGQAPRIKLSDFGSGGVLDPGKLEALGITRLGFTKTVAIDGTTSGTPIYLAPEVLAGQPFTVQADIYALGVMLYQLVVGDLRKPLSAGWEMNVPEELLGEDIAEAAAGEPGRRLNDSAQLAQRLRRLGERRSRRLAERRLKEDAEVHRRLLERIRTRRRWMAAVVVALTAGLAAATGMYWRSEQARRQAEHATSVAEALGDFLNKDLLSAAAVHFGKTGGGPSGSEITLKQLLDSAAQRVDQRFSQRPDVALRVREALGDSYLGLSLYYMAAEQYSEAVELSEVVYGSAAAETAQALLKLAWTANYEAQFLKALELQTRAKDIFTVALGALHGKTLNARMHMAFSLYRLGRFQEALHELSGVIEDAAAVADPDQRVIGESKYVRGRVLIELGRLREAEDVLRDVLGIISTHGLAHPGLEAGAKEFLGQTLALTGRFEEAETELVGAQILWRQIVGEDNLEFVISRYLLGVLRFEQRRFEEARGVLEEVGKTWSASWTRSNPWLLMTRHQLALVHLAEGRKRAAVATLQDCLRDAATMLHATHPTMVNMRIDLADALRVNGDVASFQEAVKQLGELSFDGDLSEVQKGSFLRLQAFLFAQDGEVVKATAALQDSLSIHERRFGVDNWRTHRIQQELVQLPAAPATGVPKAM